MLTSLEPRSGDDPGAPVLGWDSLSTERDVQALDPQDGPGSCGSSACSAGSETEPGGRLSGAQVTSLWGWGLRCRADSDSERVHHTWWKHTPVRSQEPPGMLTFQRVSSLLGRARARRLPGLCTLN